MKQNLRAHVRSTTVAFMKSVYRGVGGDLEGYGSVVHRRDITSMVSAVRR